MRNREVRTVRPTSGEFLDTTASTSVRIGRAALTFSTWSVAQDPDHDDRYRIEVRDAAAFPDLLGWGSEGLIDAMATAQGLAGLWHYERLAPDFVVFRMTRAL